MNHTIDFFDSQFRRQIAAGEEALNPFERLALDHARGRVLELGCGLGHLAVALALRGHPVTAVDASATAIEHLRRLAATRSLPLVAVEADAAAWPLAGPCDTAIAIGLFMFFRRDTALRLLDSLLAAVAPGGLAIVNVLVEGTTYFDMFEPGHFHLFAPAELDRALGGWTTVARRDDEFDAPGRTLKRFTTVVARRPA